MCSLSDDALILVADVGTTALKVCLFRQDMKMISCRKKEYQLLHTREGHLELEPDTYWRLFCQCVSEACAEATTVPFRVQKIVLTTQGETLIPVDREGHPLSNAIVWLDSRAQAEADEIRGMLSRESFYQHTGIASIDGTCPLCKLLWFKRHQHQLYHATSYFLLLEDYLLFCLTGRFVTEQALMSTTGYYDIQADRVWTEMLELCGLDACKIPEPLECGQAIGQITKDAAVQCGLCENTLVYAGAMDQVCAAIGAGNVKPGILTENTGTALVLGATVDSSILTSGSFHTVYRHAFSGLYLIMPICMTGGMFLKWFKDEFCADERQSAERDGYSAYELMSEEAAQSPILANGLLALPYLNGSIQPRFLPEAKGVFFGFGLEHQRRDFIRSIMESVGYMLKENLDKIQPYLPEKIHTILSGGGGSESVVWGQIKSDILNLPVCVPENHEMTALGAAILVGATDPRTPQPPKLRAEHTPNASAHHLYQEGYARYLQLLQQIEPLLQRRL